MPSAAELQILNEFKGLVTTRHFDAAQEKAANIKNILLDFDSLPPLNLPCEDAPAQRQYAVEAFEYMVLLSVELDDRDAFEKNVNSLRPYYSSNYFPQTDATIIVIGLNLLFLLVENRLADLHRELELLNDQQLSHPCVSFCISLEQHLAVGSYDQVLQAAAHPPHHLYAYFLKSLKETVRTNIGECIAASYEKISLKSATEILMFDNVAETVTFIESFYPDWKVEDNTIHLRVNKSQKSEEIPAMKLISQTLTYAIELERIV